MKSESADREHSWTDERLVAECRKGNQDAWSGLIEKYKNLIFSVPIKFGLPREDASDIFQAVCLDLLSDLPQLREPRALPKWLMQMSFHKCLRWKKQRLVLFDDPLEIEGASEASSEELPEEMMYQVQREQMLRDAVASLAPRCHRMIAMLFFESPARPYQEVAKELGLATGSIGFIRGRCLRMLRQRLQKAGFQ
ncbi:MAG TPA: sigma-70 family RNA polymerase sigma factor [Terriglobales bacterium]|nr:sigma-70 family RNA polymerase sigma factor [Terriglobales bacterium]